MVAGCSVNSGRGSSRTGPNGSGLGWRAGRGSIAAIASAEQAVSSATHAARRAPAGTELWPGRTFPEWSIVEASMHGGHRDPAPPQDGRAGHGARYEDSANGETDGPPGERELPSRPDEPPPRHRLAGGDVTGQVAGMCEIPDLGAGRRRVTLGRLARGGCASGALGRAGPGCGVGKWAKRAAKDELKYMFCMELQQSGAGVLRCPWFGNLSHERCAAGGAGS